MRFHLKNLLVLALILSTLPLPVLGQSTDGDENQGQHEEALEMDTHNDSPCRHGSVQ